MYDNMLLEYDIDDIIGLTVKQIENNFFKLKNEEKNILYGAIKKALEKCSVCFSECTNKYYEKDGRIYFNILHSGQNTVYLYYLSKVLYADFRNIKLATYVYYLNKIMNSVDLFYEIDLPNVMIFEHPVGTVLGRAQYSEKLVIYQNCTIGGNKNKYPSIGKNVTLYSYACVLGESNIGDNCIIASHTYIKDTDIPSNSIVFGSSPNLIIKPTEETIEWRSIERN
ncbi:transferase [Clostridium beijerinckii]|uniref:transferase n=1 Tax=Clostridium beijerinckii TaxID=1520 RepID=UPI001570194B|nr:transferase [Clostridium beijerinckii]NRT73701.1 serine O-acetyltransferase [Clostridium beijerinckii]